MADISVDPNGTDDPVGMVRDAMGRACESAGIDFSDLSAVVIGSPGVLDPRTGAPRLAVNLPTWHEGVRDALREVLHTPVVIENDVKLAAMAERACGVAAGLDDFAFVWLGVGLGLAAVINGQVRRGVGGAAGEIGWMPVHGAPLPAGNEHPGKAGLQALAGGHAVQALAAEHGFGGATTADAIGRRVADLARGRKTPAVRAAGRWRARPGASSTSSRTGSRSASRPSASSSTPAWSSSAATVGKAGGTELAARVAAEVARICLAHPTVVPTSVTGRAGAQRRAAGGPRAGPGPAARLARLGVRLTRRRPGHGRPMTAVERR